jgi:hypothetical protein
MRVDRTGDCARQDDIMNRSKKEAWGLRRAQSSRARLRARGGKGPEFEGNPPGSNAPGRGRLQVSKKRRNTAAVQDAGAINSVPVELTQVVDISPKVAKSYVVSRLISRRLGRKQAFFAPFLTCKGVDFSAVTEKAPDFFIGLDEAVETARILSARMVHAVETGC